MKKYRKNLILALVCFLIVIVLNFFLPRLLPGNPIAYLTGFSEEPGPADVDRQAAAVFGAEREALLREKFRYFARQVIAHLDAAQDAAWRAAGGHDLARDLAVLPAACREPERKRGQPAAPQHDESRQRRQHRHAERGQRCPGMGKSKGERTAGRRQQRRRDLSR